MNLPQPITIIILLFLLSIANTQSDCKKHKTNFYFYGCELWSTQCGDNYIFHNCTQSYCAEYTVEETTNSDGSKSTNRYCSRYGSYLYDEVTCLHKCCGPDARGDSTSFADGIEEKCYASNIQTIKTIFKVIGGIILGVILLVVVVKVIELINLSGRSWKEKVKRWFKNKKTYN